MKSMKFPAMKTVVTLLAALGLSLAPAARAATIVKANNLNNLNLTTSWTGGVAPGAADTAAFDNTSGSGTVLLGGSLSWAGISYANLGGAYTFATNGASTLTLGSGGINMAAAGQNLTINNPITLGANQSWTVNSGRTLAIGGTVGGAFNITKDGAGTLSMNVIGSFTGKTIINAGVFSMAANEAFLGANPATASADTLTINGGTLTVTASTLTIDDANRGITLGANHANFAGAGSITFSRPITGPGNLTNNNTGTMILNRTDNTYTGRTILRAGTTRAINGNSFGALPGAYVADQIIFENNAILLNQDSEFNLEPNRGITINSTGGRLQSGFYRPWGVNSIIAGSGVLTISGDPTPSYVRLNAVNTFTNEMIVNNNTGGAAWGLVAVHGSLAAGGRVRVTTNGWLLGTGTVNREVIATNGATIGGGEIGTPGTLTINGSLNLTNAILSLDEAVAGAVGSGINDLLQVNGDLVLAGVIRVRPSALGGTLAPGTYRLINYTGALTGGAGNLAADADGYTVTFDTGTAGQVDMIVSGTPTTVVWTGAAGPFNAPVWDVNNLPNFAVGMTPSVFVQNQAVLFDDTGLYLAGAVPLTFNMVGPSANFNSLFPASVTVDTTNNVILNNTGTAGKLSGPMPLTKRGSGLLALTTANGNFPNDYTGPTTVEGGILRAGYTRAFGATNGPTLATNGGTIDINGQSLGAEPFIISGAGVTNAGALVNLGGGQNNAIRYLTLAGDATVGGINRWDVRDYAANNLGGARMDGEGYALTKAGANQISFVGAGDTDIGDIVVGRGILSFELNSTLGRFDPGHEATILGGATLMHWGNVIFNRKAISIDHDGRLFKDNGNTTNLAPVTLLGGTAIIDVANNAGNIYALSNRLEGPGGFAKIGAGILQLATNNSHNGPTIVSNGTLQLFENASIDTSPLIDVKGGAVLDVTRKAGAGGLTLASGQTLQGAGTVAGGVIAGAGTAILPGTSPGTLSIASNLTLNGAGITMELNGATTEGGGVNDLITVRDLALAGPTTVRIVPLAPLNTVTPYVLARYTNSLTGNPLDLSVVSDSRYTFTPDFGAANLVRVTAAGAAGNLVWTGGTPGSETLWNLNTTTNWLNGGALDFFLQGDAVTFDDSSSFNGVSLAGALSPGTMTFNHTVDYALGGAGELKTLGTINKSGSGRLTLANNNPELNGGATISAGTLQIGDGGPSGSIGPASAITNNATLVHSRSDSNGLPNVIRGAGGFTKEGAGTLALAGANLFTGPVTVNAGTLRVGNAGAFGSTAGITVNNGGQVDLAGVTPTVRSNNYFLAGHGPDGRGALINSGGSLSGNAGITNLTLTADAGIGTFGPDASSFGRFDIGSGINPLTSLLNANEFTLTKLGPGSLNVRVVSTNFPLLVVSNGVVYGENVNFNLASNIVVHSGGQVGMFGAYLTNSSALTLHAGATVVNVGGNGTNVWTGPVTNLGRSVMNVTGLSGNGHIQFGNNLYGSGPLSVIGGNNRAVELRTNNDATFSGPWAIAGGTFLRLLGNGTPGTGAITNLGGIEWFTTNAHTLAQDIIGSPVNGLFRHHALAGALDLGGTVIQNNVTVQNGDLGKPMTLLSGASLNTASLSVGITNFAPTVGSGRLNINSGASLTAGNFFLGDQNFQTGVVVQAAGTAVVVSNQFRVAHWPNNLSTYTMDGGTFTVPTDPVANPASAAISEQNGGFYIGIDGVGSFTQNDGTLTTANIVLDNRGSSTLSGSTNTYNLNGGTVVLGRWGIQSPNSTYQINLGGGTIESSANWTSTLRMTLTAGLSNTVINPAATRTNTLSGVLSGPGGLIKEGAGALLLHGNSTFTGGVTVNNGALGGNGTLSSPVIVGPGGILSPGVSPGTLTVTNDVTLEGTTVMEVSRTGATLAADRLIVADPGLLDFGGALVVTNIGQSLIGGEVFQLFVFTLAGDTFSSVSLPPLAPHLSWDTSTLYVDGAIRVLGPPTLAQGPVSQTVYECDNVIFTGLATNMNPFTVQWQKDGIDIPGATSATLVLTNVMLSDAATYTFCASNAFGGACASATLTVLEVTNLTAGLIAYYPLDDFNTVNNTTADATANMQTLTGTGLVASNVVAGARTNAFNFNGAASNIISRTHTGGEALPAYAYPAYSVAFWVRANFSGQNDRRAFAEGSTTNNTPLWGIGTHNTGGGPQADVFIRNMSATPVDHIKGTKPVFDGTWHHVVWVDNNGSGTLYVDGALDTNIHYVRVAMNLNTFAIGNLQRAAVGAGLTGDIDDFAVWRRSLKSNEVYCVMTNSLNGPPAITTPPAGQTVECSSNATFTVAATSTDTALTYQWYFSNAALPDETNASLTVVSGPATAGNYHVVIANCAGSSTSVVAVLTVGDTTAPTITACAPASNIVADASCVALVPDLTGLVTATDCSGSFTVTQSPVAGSAAGLGPHTVTISVTDGSNNTAQCLAAVTVLDQTPPTITNCAPAQIVAASAACDALLPDLTALLIVGDCGGAVTVTQSPLPGLTLGLGPQPVTLYAVDPSGNVATCISTVTVTDQTPPAISQCAADVTLSADTNGNVTLPDLRPQVMASDNCGGVTVAQNPPPGSTISLGTNEIVFTVTDAASNASSCTSLAYVVEADIPPAFNTQPQSVTNECGSTAVLTVEVTGTTPISYQWYLGVAVVPDATNATLTLAGITPAQSGNYTVIATNVAGSATSEVAVVTVVDTTPPSVTCPADITLKSASTNGTNATFAASASDSCGSANVVCVPASGSIFPVGTTVVTCTATDDALNTNACTFTVTVYLAQTMSVSVNAPVPDGSSLGLASVLNVSTPMGVLSDVNVTLNISNGWNGDLFAYLVHDSGFAVLLNRAGKRATDPLGYDDSGFNVTLDDQAAADVHSYRLTLNASHLVPLGGPLTNAWQPDGRAVDPSLVLDTDARTALLASFNGLNPNGEWVLFVQDDASGDTSTLVSWGLELCGTLGVSPSVTTPPASQSIGCGSNVTFSAQFAGTRPMGFQWYRDGVPIPGATSSNLTLFTVLPSDAANYTVQGSNAFGTTLSAPAVLTVFESLAVITAQPESRTNNVGATASFTIVVLSCGPVTYQWCFGATPLSGETNASLSVPNVQLANGGDYTVKVSNTAGSVTSAVAVLTINREPTAFPNGVATTEGLAVVMPGAKLAANDTDPDGDPLTVSSVSATSTNGGSVTLLAGAVTYTPLPGFSGLDRFTYTVSDGRGGFGSSYVEVFVVDGNLPSANQVSITAVPGGFLIRFAGVPGYTYQLQRATAPTGPWGTLTSVVAPLHGIIEYLDTNPPMPSAFYRTVAP